MQSYYMFSISSNFIFNTEEEAEEKLPNIKIDIGNLLSDYRTVVHMVNLRSEFHDMRYDITICYKLNNRVDVDYLIGIINEIKTKNNMEKLRIHISENYE